MQHLWFSQGEKHMLGTKRLTIILAAAALAAAAQGAWAEEKAATDAGDSAGTELGDIIVTGTRRTDRTVIESSAPIDVLTGADLAAQSTGNMLDTLSNMVPPSSSARIRFRMPRASCVRHRCVVCPATRCWCC